MSRSPFEAARHRQQLHLVRVCQHLDDSGRTNGEGASLVDDERAYLFCVLECSGIANEYPGLGTAAGPDHDRCWRREPERTRTGNNEHCNRIDQRLRQFTREDPPGDERHGTDRNNGRHKHRSHPVSRALNGCLAALGLPRQPDDLCKLCFGSRCFGSHPQQAIEILRACIDPIARGFSNR